MKILIFPKDPNPYQELLYRSIRSKKIDVDYLANPTSFHTIGLILFIPYICIYRIKGYDVFHLHWQHFKIFFFNKYISYFLSTCYGIFILFLIKLLGYKLIWTIHNIVPHEQIFINDLLFTKIIYSISDKVIVHDRNTFDVLAAMNLQIKKMTIIPIGMYKKLDISLANKTRIRNNMNIRKKDFMILFFGIIREYKGVDDLLKATKFFKSEPHIKIFIVGDCKDKDLLRKIDNYKKNNSNIYTRIEYVSEEVLNSYLIASDIVVLPYNKVTTSSTAIFALTNGKPIVAPLIGPFTHFDDRIGYFYKQGGDGLYKALLEAIRDKNLHKKSEQAIHYSKKYDWDSIALATLKVYTE